METIEDKWKKRHEARIEAIIEEIFGETHVILQSVSPRAVAEAIARREVDIVARIANLEERLDALASADCRCSCDACT